MPNFDFLTTGAEFEVFRIGFFPGWGRAGIISIGVHDLGDVLEAQKIQKQVPMTCVSFREF